MQLVWSWLNALSTLSLSFGVIEHNYVSRIVHDEPWINLNHWHHVYYSVSMNMFWLNLFNFEIRFIFTWSLFIVSVFVVFPCLLFFACKTYSLLDVVRWFWGIDIRFPMGILVEIRVKFKHFLAFQQSLNQNRQIIRYHDQDTSSVLPSSLVIGFTFLSQ